MKKKSPQSACPTATVDRSEFPNLTIGVLALQGCVEPHAEHVRRLGAKVSYVRSPRDLTTIQGLILPGGESTTMLRLIDRASLWQPLLEFGTKLPCWGICAGAILIASEVENPSQPSLGLMPIKARRNHYGSQLDSFTTEVTLSFLDAPLSVDFIRAPLLSALSSEVIVAGSCNGAAVCLQHRQHLATSFHAELGHDSRLHQYFLRRCTAR